MIIYVMRGLPASGKTTFAKKEFPDLPILSSDAYIEEVASAQGKSYNEVFQDCIEEAQKRFNVALEEHINAGNTFVIDRTNCGKNFMPKHLEEKAQRNGYKIKFINMPIDIKQIQLNNANRKEKVISPEVIRNFFYSLMQNHADAYSFKDKLNAMKDMGLVKFRDCGDYRVVKYSRDAYFRNKSFPLLEECRGLVIDKDYNIVSIGLRKSNEIDVNTLDKRQIYYVSKKVNGYMASATAHNNKLVVSTTGSLEGWFAENAKKKLLQLCPNLVEYLQKTPNRTYFFEVVDPEDPHIVEECPGVYYFGYREKYIGTPFKPVFKGTYEYLNDYFIVVSTQAKRGYEIQDTYENNQTLEGYMLFDPSGLHKKIKFPFYQAMKLIARSKRFIDNDQTLNKLNERFAIVKRCYKTKSTEKLIDYVENNCAKLIELEEQQRLSLLREKSYSVY